MGVAVTRDSVVPVNALATQPTLLAGPALLAQVGDGHNAFDGAYVRLKPGTNVSSFTDHADALAQQFPLTGGGVFVADETQQAAKVEQAIRPEAVALALFALLAGIVALFAVGQVLVRQALSAAAETPTLRSLGMTPRQLFAVAMVPVAISAVAGAALAVGVAWIASAWMPIANSRTAEPHPGFSFDAVVLGVGFAAVVASCVAIAAWPAWRSTRSAPNSMGAPPRAVGRLGTLAAQSGVPVSVAVGLGQTATPTSIGRALPTRSALMGVTVALAAIVAALTFGVNLSRFVQTPRLYGQTWDITADAQFSVLPQDAINTMLRREVGVTTWTFGEHVDISINGQPVPAIALDTTAKSKLTPTLVAGREPVGTDEIVLGTKTLERAHLRIGDTAAVVTDTTQASDATQTMHIVGTSVFPFFGRGSFTPAGLGVGALMLGTPPVAANPNDLTGYNFVLISVAGGPDHRTNVDRVVHDLAANICNSGNQCLATTTSRPVDVLNYARVQSTPLVLAAVLAVLGVLVLAYLLLTSLRRRRREFVILKTLGFTRHQVHATVASHATVVVAFALLIGTPLGIALGRAAWSLFASNLGVTADPATPGLPLAITIVVALAVANATAAAPAVLAARLRPAAALRAD